VITDGDTENQDMLIWCSMEAVTLSRPDLVRRGQRLEYFTIAYNSAEGLVSIIA